MSFDLSLRMVVQEQQHVRAAWERQRWNELAQDIVAACRKKVNAGEERESKVRKKKKKEEK